MRDPHLQQVDPVLPGQLLRTREPQILDRDELNSFVAEHEKEISRPGEIPNVVDLTLPEIALRLQIAEAEIQALTGRLNALQGEVAALNALNEMGQMQ